MTMTGLSVSERLKFGLLGSGMSISEAAQHHVDAHNGDRPMTPADYASTSGVILALDDDVWVNAPIARYNPNLVTEPEYVLDEEAGHLVVRGNGLESPAWFWLPPAYHDETLVPGESMMSYAITHADRVRISPIEGCSMRCQFCDLPYEFRYRTKDVAKIVQAVARALVDPIQPAHHILISGGTPHTKDIEYVRSVYQTIISSFPGVAVDIMMVPVEDLMNIGWLNEIGVNEISVNIEIFNAALAKEIMRQKARQGLDVYLDYLVRAVQILGDNRVRSMLLVGIEPMEDTLAGVEAIAQRGAVPVLSPFRPDPSTPLANSRPPTANELEETYLRARDIADRIGVPLGPSCIPCSHNTLTLSESGSAARYYGQPHLI